MNILKGRPVADLIDRRIIDVVERSGLTPRVKSVLIGLDKGAKAYAGVKGRKAAKLGIEYEILEMPEKTSQGEFEALISELSGNDKVDGVIIERPVPDHLDIERALAHLNPQKDIDCATPHNLGRILLGDARFYPATADSVLRILDHYGVHLPGSHVVIAGRSLSVGKPLANMLLERSRSATVTVCHSHTKDMAMITRSADVLVAAIGRAKFFGTEYISKDTIVIDVGTNYTDDGLFGDVDIDAVEDIVYAITPVPGGVGPVTTSIIMENSAKAALKRRGLDIDHGRNGGNHENGCRAQDQEVRRKI